MNNNRNCNSNKYCTDGECSVNVRELPWTWLPTCQACADRTFLPYIHLSLKSPQWEQSASQGDWKTDLLSLDPSSPERPAEKSPQNLKKRSFVRRIYAPTHGHKTTVFVMWHSAVRLWAIKGSWTSVDTYPYSNIILELGRLLTKTYSKGGSSGRGSFYAVLVSSKCRVGSR